MAAYTQIWWPLKFSSYRWRKGSDVSDVYVMTYGTAQEFKQRVSLKYAFPWMTRFFQWRVCSISWHASPPWKTRRISMPQNLYDSSLFFCFDIRRLMSVIWAHHKVTFKSVSDLDTICRSIWTPSKLVAKLSCKIWRMPKNYFVPTGMLRTPYFERWTSNTILRTPNFEQYTLTTVLRTLYSKCIWQILVVNLNNLFDNMLCAEKYITYQKIIYIFIFLLFSSIWLKLFKNYCREPWSIRLK